VADTGLPWELPYPLPTDLVRDGAQAIQDLAEATATGLSAVGGLVAVKHVIKTDTQVSSAVGAAANVAVTGLSITHTLTSATNKLKIFANFGVAANDNGRGNVGLAVAVDGTVIGVGDAAGSRSRVGAGGVTVLAQSNEQTTSLALNFVYEPGDTDPHTYTVRAINVGNANQTLYINRSEIDGNAGFNSRAASNLIIEEIRA